MCAETVALAHPHGGGCHPHAARACTHTHTHTHTHTSIHKHGQCFAQWRRDHSIYGSSHFMPIGTCDIATFLNCSLVFLALCIFLFFFTPYLFSYPDGFLFVRGHLAAHGLLFSSVILLQHHVAHNVPFLRLRWRGLQERLWRSC